MAPNVGTHSDKLNVGNKKELLDHTKSVAVKVVHKDVH